MLTAGNELVLKADIESRVGVGGKCHSRLAHDIFGPSVLISHRVLDMHIDYLPIALRAIDYRRDQDQGIFANEVPYTSVVLRIVSCVGCKIKFQSPGEGDESTKE